VELADDADVSEGWLRAYLRAEVERRQSEANGEAVGAALTAPDESA
jgi:hypothetical protein